MPLDKTFATPDDESSYEEPKLTKRAKKEETNQEEKVVEELNLKADLEKLEKEAEE